MKSNPSTDQSRHHWTWMWANLAIVCVAVIAGVLLWDAFPDPVPIHFDASGTPDGFRAKTGPVVFSTILAVPVILTIISAAVVGLLLHNATQSSPVTDREKEKLARWGGFEKYRAVQLAMLDVASRWLFALSAIITPMVVVSILGTRISVWLMLGAIAISCILLALNMRRVIQQADRDYPPTGQEKSLRSKMKLGMFYFDPDDSATFIDHPNGMTLNFARPGAWGMLAVLLLPALLIVTLATLT